MYGKREAEGSSHPEQGLAHPIFLGNPDAQKYHLPDCQEVSAV